MRRHIISALQVDPGITPILSILRTVLARRTKKPAFTLVYANRTPNTIMFREELEDLKNLHLGRLNVIHILEDESQEIDLFRGRVDAAKCKALFDAWIDIRSISMAFICGPEPMMKAISAALGEHGLTKDQIRFELFASSQPGRAPTRAKSAGETGQRRSGAGDPRRGGAELCDTGRDQPSGGRASEQC